jgi:hypothetical protein
MVVKRDGHTMATAAIGIALPVDPGGHTITSQAPGGPEHEVKITLAKGEKKTVVVELKAPPAAPPAVTAPPPEAPAGPSRQRVAAYVLVGIGAAGLVAGGVMGGLTLAKKSTIDQHCGASVGSSDPTACDATGLSAVSSGRTLGWASTAALIGGGALAGTAIVLFAAEPRRPKAVGVVSIGPTGAIIGARGAW